MMKNLRVILGLVFLGLAATILIGLMLPAGWSARAQVEIDVPPDEVFAYVGRLKSWERWAVWFDHDPDMAVTYTGPETGDGSAYTWSGNRAVGAGSVSVERYEPGREIEIRLEMNHGRFLAKGAIHTQPFGSGTRVTWELKGSLGHDPFARLNRKLLETAVTGTLSDSLEKLKRVAEQQAATARTGAP